MTKEQKLTSLKVRLNKIKTRGKDEDCPGVRRKIERQIRNLEKEQGYTAITQIAKIWIKRRS